MSKEYIEREAAKARLRIRITDCVLDGDNEAADCFRDCIDLLDSIPAADVAPVVHGRWERIRSNWYCTRCKTGYRITCGAASAKTFTFCPNCGAKMDKEEADGTERTN